MSLITKSQNSVFHVSIRLHISGRLEKKIEENGYLELLLALQPTPDMLL